jgi:hypothetical protein
MNLLNLIFGVTNEHTHSLVEQTKTTIQVGDRFLIRNSSGDKPEKEINRRNHKNNKTAQQCVCHSDINIAGTNPAV